MGYEHVTNPPASAITLTATCNPGDATISVSAAAPITENFRILIDTELLLVTGGASGNTWNVTHAIEGTSSATHSSGAAITFLLTADAINQLLLETSGVGTYASRPTATTGARAGMHYQATDTPNALFFDGSAWQDITRGVVRLERVITASSASSVDFSSIPAGFSNLYVTFQARSNVSGSIVGLRMKVNNDSTAGHYTTVVYVLASGISGFGTVSPTTDGTFITNLPGTSATANYPTNGRIWIENYALTTFYKKFTHSGNYAQSGNTDIFLSTAGSWISTAAINQLTFVPDNPQTFLDGSVFTLYGEL